MSIFSIEMNMLNKVIILKFETSDKKILIFKVLNSEIRYSGFRSYRVSYDFIIVL